jgi:hypothetical protein
MAEGLSAADRFTLQTALSHAGVSHLGAAQLANEQPVTDPADRGFLARLICMLLSESQHGTGHFAAQRGKRVVIAFIATTPSPPAAS